MHLNTDLVALIKFRGSTNDTTWKENGKSIVK